MFISDGTDKNTACGKRVAATASEVIYKDVLGNEKESANFRAFVLNGLQSRGMKDIFIACTDILAEFEAAIHVAFPQTEIQNSSILQLRSKAKSVFPTDDSLLKMPYLAMMDNHEDVSGLEYEPFPVGPLFAPHYDLYSTFGIAPEEATGCPSD